jgi:uncharacterized glyoxalase superfamily protein PhnB
MSSHLIITFTAFLITLLGSAPAIGEKPKMKKLTPVIVVDQIEPCLLFWIDRLGFQKTVGVPEGDKLGFVSLAKGNVEIMYQTKSSVEKDLPGIIKEPGRPSTGLYIEVERLDSIIEALKGLEVVVPERTTFYGAHEFGVREPGGSLVLFAEFAKAK